MHKGVHSPPFTLSLSGADLSRPFFITPVSSCRARNGTEAAGKLQFLGVAKSAQHLALSQSAVTADVS